MADRKAKLQVTSACSGQFSPGPCRKVTLHSLLNPSGGNLSAPVINTRTSSKQQECAPSVNT